MTVGGRSVRSGKYSINFSRKVGYFFQVLDLQPRVIDGSGKTRPPSEFKSLAFRTKSEVIAALSLLNSNLFYWFITVFSDCRHLNKREVDAMPFPDMLCASTDLTEQMSKHSKALMENLRLTADIRKMKFRHDQLEIECIIPKRSKKLIDVIDQGLASTFDFTEEETDYIINYDIKYRMGGTDEDDGS